MLWPELSDMPPVKIVFGCGYLGLRVARLWRVTRSEARMGEFAAELIGAVNADVADATSLEAAFGPLRMFSKFGLTLESALYAVGYDRTSDADIHTVYAKGLENVLAVLPPSVRQVVYISTTGVYGSAGGEWVDEATPPRPQREGGKASLAAERVLASHPLGQRSAILRLAGIYGPGRVPYLDKLRADEPLPVPTEGWLNLIHVDDAARIVVAVEAWLQSREAADGPHVFCVSDGAPVQRAAYYAEVAQLIGAPAPTFCPPPADSPTAARAAADRRVSNEKLRSTLAVDLLYPSYREGLAAILREGGDY
jgi:nucleoside-diphosphate-sugar epimerase